MEGARGGAGGLVPSRPVACDGPTGTTSPDGPLAPVDQLARTHCSAFHDTPVWVELWRTFSSVAS